MYWKEHEKLHETGLIVQTEESLVSGGGICEWCDEDDPYPSYEDEFYDYDVVKAFRPDGKRNGIGLEAVPCYNFDPKDPTVKVATVVSLRYNTGSTFGHSEGHGDPLFAYDPTKMTADEEKDMLEFVDNYLSVKGLRTKDTAKRMSQYMKCKIDPNNYWSCDGYFESFHSLPTRILRIHD